MGPLPMKCHIYTLTFSCTTMFKEVSLPPRVPVHALGTQLAAGWLSHFRNQGKPNTTMKFLSQFLFLHILYLAIIATLSSPNTNPFLFTVFSWVISCNCFFVAEVFSILIHLLPLLQAIICGSFSNY